MTIFSPDTIALKAFYASALGQATLDAIRQAIAGFLQECHKEAVVGIGFPSPFLSDLLSDNTEVFSVMPPTQGVLHWGNANGNLSLLSHESELPFPDNSICHILVVHALENSEQARQMMEEIWRVLAPSGKVMLIAPNRRGIWARSPHSPFAYGQPFTATQLRELCLQHSFTPLRYYSALFFPPSRNEYLVRLSAIIEKIGKPIFYGLGGVIAIEAEKQLYAPIMRKIPAHKFYYPSLQPVAYGKDAPDRN